MVVQIFNPRDYQQHGNLPGSSVTVAELVRDMLGGMNKDEFAVTYNSLHHIVSIRQHTNGTFTLIDQGGMKHIAKADTRLGITRIVTKPLTCIYVDGRDLAAGDVIHLRDGSSFAITTISAIHFTPELGSHRLATGINQKGETVERQFSSLGSTTGPYQVIAGHKLESARRNRSLIDSNDAGFHYWKRNARALAHIPGPPAFIKELPMQWEDLSTREKNLLKKAAALPEDMTLRVSMKNKTAFGLQRKGLLKCTFAHRRHEWYSLTPAARELLLVK